MEELIVITYENHISERLILRPMYIQILVSLYQTSIELNLGQKPYADPCIVKALDKFELSHFPMIPLYTRVRDKQTSKENFLEKPNSPQRPFSV